TVMAARGSRARSRLRLLVSHAIGTRDFERMPRAGGRVRDCGRRTRQLPVRRRVERRVFARAVNGVDMGHVAVDLKLKNIGPVVMTSKIVPQFHLNADLEITLGVKYPLLSTY